MARSTLKLPRSELRTDNMNGRDDGACECSKVDWCMGFGLCDAQPPLSALVSA